ncbi:MAG: GC-type dockerin domain-anchored protein [Phycisphaerales bacterium JB064]
MARSIVLVCGCSLALSAAALADDTTGSTKAVFDSPLLFEATGELLMHESGADGFNTADPLNPTTFYEVHAHHWSFDLWYVVDGWDFAPGGPPDDGAHMARIGLRGEHTVPPAAPPHGEGPLKLDAVLGGEAMAGGAMAADIRFGSGAILSVSAAKTHGKHIDWYGAYATVHAYDPVIAPFDPTDPTERRHLRGGYEIQGHHTDETFVSPWNDDGTLATPVDTVVSFDPGDGVLRLRLGPVSVLDTEGGRTGGVAPEFADDPLVGVRPSMIEMRYAGFDPDRGAHIFAGGRLLIEGRDGSAVAIGGEIGEMAISTTVPGDALGAWAPFDRLWVVDAIDPDVPASTWARAFVREGWFGESPRLFPVLSMTTIDGDLVDSTDGFRRRAELPASVALTIAVPAPCAADLDGDGELTIFDFLAFQNLFDAGDPAADFDGDGELTIFDFLAFQNAFDAGCP